MGLTHFFACRNIGVAASLGGTLLIHFCVYPYILWLGDEKLCQEFGDKKSEFVNFT